ncbi:hypothetical protein [Rhodococcus sp. ARC_M6]|uniref:hypothetical protein n=1 Tax=Rhodococcus sp. ARC_M6 TaxID=2928852 RepID=UPI001FB30746|nr:hypothetical protein [Rhodococcus sp. ARC_M6]MCJ0904096.1 hypothetical protein [Rhodococcus sp. ARC_M6]
MEFAAYLRVLRRRWLYVVIQVMIGLIGGLVISALSTPRYESVSRIFLATPGWGTPVVMSNSESSPYRGNEFSQLRAASYLRLSEGEDFRLRVEERLGTAPADVPDTDSLDFRVVPDTVMIELTAMAASPERAQDLANALTVEMTESIEKLETPSGTLIPVIQPIVVDSARLSGGPSEPRTGLLVGGGGVLGLLAGVSIAVVAARTSRRVHTALELATISSLPVLATFGDEARMVGEAAASRLRFNLEYLGTQFSTGILAVSSPLPDASTSAVARGLVRATAETGLRTIHVHCGIRGNSGQGSRGLADVLRGSASVDDVVTEPTPGHGYVIETGDVPGVVSGLLESRNMQAILDDLRHRFDLVVLDIPGFLASNDAAVLGKRSDAVLVVASEGISRIDDLMQTFDGFHTVGARVVGSVLIRSRSQSEHQFDYIAAPDPFRQSESTDAFVSSARTTSRTTRGVNT